MPSGVRLPDADSGPPDALRGHVFAVLATPGPLAAFRATPGRREVRGSLALTAAGGRGPDFNYAAVFGAWAPDALFRAAAAFLGPDERYSLIVEAETSHVVEAELACRGWTLDEEEPALALPAVPDPLPAPPSKLTIRRVGSETELAHFRAISGGGDRWLPSVNAATAPGVAVFVGYVAGQPVATSRVARHAHVGDITGVVTRPDLRRRGYGTAMTWTAVAAAVEMGCAAFVLTATELGYPVYRKMGFVPVCTLRTYLPPGGAKSGE